MAQRFVKRSRIEAPAERVFAWHGRAEAFTDLTPPWEPAQVVERTGGIDEVGSRLVIKIGRRPVRLTWIAEHTAYEAGRMFRDVQRRGPFARWEHTHLVEPDGDDACWLTDDVTYALPGGPLAELVAGWFVRRKLQRMFDYRHEVTARANERPTG